MHSASALRFFAMSAVGISLVACGGGGGSGPDYDPAQTMQALQDKVGVNGIAATVQPGNPPAPNSQDVKADAPNADVAVVVGARATIPITVTSAAALDRLFAKIPGASTYFEIALNTGASKSARAAQNGSLRPLSSVRAKADAVNVNAKGTTTYSFQVDVPATLTAGGRLCFELSAQDVDNRTSDPDLACLSILAPTPVPTATPAPTPSPGNDSAAACLNPALFSVGANVQQTYRETFGGETYSYNDSYTVPRETTFNGNSAVELVYAEGGTDYLRAEPANQRVLIFGVELDGETITYDPPFAVPLGLTPGQSQTRNITVTVSGSQSTEQVDVISTLTYVGRERITVPAGTFNTCRFKESATYSGNSEGIDLGFAQDADVWFAVSSGLTVRDEIRSEFGTFLSELVSASINGQAVTGN